MKFSTLIAADLVPENQVLGNGKAANPANPANLIDLQRNSVANLLLISAKDLLIGEQDQPPPVEISSGLANFSNGLANERQGIINGKQGDAEKLAELATLAVLEKPENLNTPLSPPETAALAILRELYRQHRQRLVDGGHKPQGARVRGDTYRAALLARGIPLEAAIALRQTKRVKSDGLYWSLVDEVML